MGNKGKLGNKHTEVIRGKYLEDFKRKMEEVHRLVKNQEDLEDVITEEHKKLNSADKEEVAKFTRKTEEAQQNWKKLEEMEEVIKAEHKKLNPAEKEVVAEYGYYLEEGDVDGDTLGAFWENTGVYPYTNYPF